MRIKGTDTIDYADSICIIFGGKCVKEYLSDERCLDYTFDELLNDARENGYTGEGTILVVAESRLSGTVYRYGNYGPYWTKIGTTIGYA